MDLQIGFNKCYTIIQFKYNFMITIQCKYMLPPCHFLLYSSNTIVTLTEETNRSRPSDTKKLDHLTLNAMD